MKPYALLTVTVLAVFSATMSASAAEMELDVQHITAQDGLPANSVRCLFQDSRGFLWIGTINNGLCKYDGTSFTTIMPDRTDGPGLADNRISGIKEDADGHLWITTMSEQISCYDLRTERFVDYSGTGSLCDRYGHVDFTEDGTWLWGTTQGCMRVQYEDGKFFSECFSTSTNSLPSDYVSCLMNDGDITWIGTPAGLSIYQNGKIETLVTGTHFISCMKLEEEVLFVSSGGDIWRRSGEGVEHVTRISQISDSGSLITGTFSPDGVSLMIFTTDSAYAYDIFDGTVSQAPKPYDLYDARVMDDGHGNHLVYDKVGNVVFVDAVQMHEKAMNLMLSDKRVFWSTRYGFTRTAGDVVWISTHENGLFAYDINLDKVHHFNMEDLTGGNSSNILMCVSEDDSGNLWVGSEFSGIFKIKVINEGAAYMHFGDSRKNEYSDMVRMIGTHDDDEVWICTRDGSVYIYDTTLRNRRRVTRYPANVYATCRDTVSRLWVGTRGKGLFVNGANHTHRKDDPRSLSSDIIFDMLKDNDGNMWVGTFGGGVNLAENDGKGGLVFRNFFNDSYSRRHVRALCQDLEGNIWVGNSNGVIVFDPEKIKSDPSAYETYNSDNHRLRSNECRALACDSKGRMYVAETGAGFSICIPSGYKNLQFTHYGTKDGLVNGLVQGFIEDEAGRMWISTEYGVSCFDPENESFRSFMFSSDMQSNVCLDNCAARLPDGRVLLGTNSGMAVIDPSEVSLSGNRTGKKAVFTSLKIHGKDVAPGTDDSPIVSAVSYSPDVTLQYSQNSFVLTFSTLDFSNDALYSYILEGYDDSWTPASTMNMAAYRHLPPGKYEFKVRARDGLGDWQEEATAIKIVVKPPFYKTILAYVVYLLLLLVVIYVVNRLLGRFNKLKNAARIEKELTEYKLVFFTNISHEFRTPLTLILHSLEKLRRSETVSRDHATTISTMEAGTNRLLRLVNQLLEFRKIQNDRHSLRLERTDVVRFCREIYETFRESAHAKNIEFNFIPSVNEYFMFMDQGDMDKVIYNLISNAIKYTPEGGSVDFTVEVLKDEAKVRFRVSDNGIGVPKDKQKDIFTRFSPGESSESSMGIGLHLTKSLVDANKGTISYMENPDGQGTVMTVDLPVSADAYAPEDFKTDTGNTVTVSMKESVVEHAGVYEAKPAKPINPHKILVVDDESEIRRLIVEELQEYFNVVEAVDGKGALDILHSDEGVELVVCDVMMPGMSGYEVASAIKEDFATCHIPVILLTALDSESKKLEGIKSGADAYITKPFRPDYVLTRILKLLEQRNRLREKFSNDLSLKTESICTNDLDREFMDKIDAIIDKHLGNPDFSMDDFASEMAMGRSSFYNKIHKVTGYSPNRYIRILRMKKAAELILTGKYTAAEVSYKVGIQDASYFSKSFKEQFGISPKSYYKQAKAGLNPDNSQDD